LLKEVFLDLKQETYIQELIKVKDYWDHTHHIKKWRISRHIDCRNNNPPENKSGGTHENGGTKEDISIKRERPTKMGQ